MGAHHSKGFKNKPTRTVFGYAVLFIFLMGFAWLMTV